LELGKSIADTEAEEIISKYNSYINKDYISLYRFAVEYYRLNINKDSTTS
jgi:hypothetical protein